MAPAESAFQTGHPGALPATPAFEQGLERAVPRASWSSAVAWRPCGYASSSPGSASSDRSGGRGGIEPRSPLRLLGGDDHAVSARLGGDEPQSCSGVRPEELVVVADQQRVDPETQLVEQAVVDQRLAERAMAIHDEIAL